MQSSKYIFLSLFSALVTLTSCDRSDDPKFAQEMELATDSVNLPSDSMALGRTLRITTYHKLASNCELFQGYSQREIGDEKQITAYYVKTDSICGNTSVSEVYMNFTPKIPMT